MATHDRYERYVASEAYRLERTRKARVIAHLCREYLRGDARAADLGAGTGIIRSEVERLTGRPLLGFEIDDEFIVERRRMCRANILRLPVRSRGLDFLILNHVYEHVGDPAELFREAYRVLAPGGAAYVAAGSRLAVVEPHYRLPFLGWLPKRAATLYLRLTRRGRSYEGIQFLSYGPLTRLMRGAGFMVQDITERALDELLADVRGHAWSRAWQLTRRLLPPAARRSLLRALSPQWFFVLERPPLPPDSAPAGASRRAGQPGSRGRGSRPGLWSEL